MEQFKTFHRQGLLQVVAGATMISFSGVYVKIAHVEPTAAGFYRHFFGGFLLIIIVLLRRESLWKDFPYFLSSALCGCIFALDIYVWHRSVLYIGPGLATILANFQVFILALFGLFYLGEKIQINRLLGMSLALLGLFMIVGIRWEQLDSIYRTGVILGLAAALCYAVYLLILRKLQATHHCLSPLVNLTVISLVSAFVLGTLAWGQGEDLRIPDVHSFIVLIVYGIFSQVLGWVLISRGLPKLSASLAGLLLLLQPTLAFIWDMLFFHRETTPVGLFGVALTIGAIYLGTIKKAKGTKPRGQVDSIEA